MARLLLKAVIGGSLLLMLLPVLAVAQSSNGLINGMVTDPSGALVPNAEMTLTAKATGVVLKTKTGPQGLYSFPDLVPGPYTLEVKASGFRNYIQSGIVLGMNSEVRVNVKLSVGASVQSVQVSSNASPLTYQGSVIKHSVSPQVLQDLPLQFQGTIRNVVNFVTLVPGVNTGGQNQPKESSINGGQNGEDAAIWDGVSFREGLLGFDGTISFADIPVSPAAVSEMNVQTSTFNPKYGNSDSAVIIVVTKSGTDKFHGSLYEFLRNTAFNARTFGQPFRPVDHENDFGGNVGGPIRLPYIWSGANKSYFFFNYEGYRSTGAVSQPTLSVPTMQERQGDFSDWTDSNGNLIPVYDPATTAPNPSFNPAQPVGASNEPILRQQFTGNVIPAARLAGSLAQGWLKYLPSPNHPGVVSNYIPPGIVAKSGLNNWDLRLDDYLKNKDHFMLTLHHSTTLPAPATFLPPQVSSNGYRSPQYSWVNRVSWDHIFGPNLLNNFNAGYLDLYTNEVNIGDSALSQIPQIPGVLHDQPSVLTFTNFAQMGYNAHFTQTRPNVSLNDTLSWVNGRHTLDFGFDYFNSRLDNKSNANNDSGTFHFATQETGLPGIRSGSDMASFLLGLVDNANASVYGAFGSQYAFAEAGGGFFGDTWKTTPKLTVTYGIRWDLNMPSVEKYNRFSFLDPTRANPDAGGRLGALVFAGNGWGPASFGRRHPEYTWYRAFSPRLGIAYAVTPKTVIRTGYGIFFDQNFYPGFNGGIANDGFTANPVFTTPDGGISPAFMLQNGFPQTFTQPPILSMGFDNGQSSITYRPFDANEIPYGQMWNLSVEHEFTNNFTVSTAYVANKGTHLLSAVNPLNALNPQMLSMGQALFAEFAPGQTSLDGVNAPYAGWASQMQACAPTVAQALVAFPQYCGNLYGLNENQGDSHYNSLQITANERLHRGFYLLGSYTWEKMITDSTFFEPTRLLSSLYGGAVSPYERSRAMALSPYDVPNILSVAAIYNLPFGPGAHFLNHSGIVGAIAGGWQLSTIFKIASGVPFFFRSSQCNIPPQFAAGCIPGILPGANPFRQSEGSFDPAKGPLLNAAAFQSPSQFNFYTGAGSVTSGIRTPGYHDQDFGLTRTIKLSERFSMQLEGEFFNAWNWHTFTTDWENGNPAAVNAFIYDVASPRFGDWNGNVSAPRNIQVSAQIIF